MIMRSVVGDEDFTSALVAHGVPEAQAAFSLAMFAAMRAGDFAAVDRHWSRCSAAARRRCAKCSPPASRRDARERCRFVSDAP
jgi:hypothetical protein